MGWGRKDEGEKITGRNTVVLCHFILKACFFIFSVYMSINCVGTEKERMRKTSSRSGEEERRSKEQGRKGTTVDRRWKKWTTRENKGANRGRKEVKQEEDEREIRKEGEKIQSLTLNLDGLTMLLTFIKEQWNNKRWWNKMQDQTHTITQRGDVKQVFLVFYCL